MPARWSGQEWRYNAAHAEYEIGLAGRRVSGARDFGELQRRALERLQQAGGRCSGAELERAVFGASGGGLWSRLLAQALADEPRFQPDGDDWRLVVDDSRFASGVAPAPVALPRSDRAADQAAAPTGLMARAAADPSDRARSHPSDASADRTPPPEAASTAPDPSPTARRLSESPVLTVGQPVAGDLRIDAPAGIADALMGRYAILDVEATGARPERHRVTEVAVLVVDAGQISLTYHTLVNPQRRVPRLLHEHTGLTQDLADEAPAFGEIADDLLDALGDLPLVGHEVGAAVAFLNRELDRLGRLPVLNPRHELIPLAVAVLPELGRRKPSLDNLAAAAGVPRPLRRGALRDARLVAALCRTLRGRPSETTEAGGDPTVPPPSAEPDTATAEAEPARHPFDMATAPDAPGVYLMRDGAGAVLYVGRSVSLRRRLMSYAAGPIALTRALDGLRDTVASIDWQVCDSVLETMLLEHRRLREHRPRFNTQLGSVPPPLWLKVDVLEEFPRLGLAREPLLDGARYFGPYRTGAAAALALRWAADTIPIRTCRRRMGARRNPHLAPCPRLARGLCLGPCTGALEPADYAPAVADTLAFLEGDRSAAERHVRARLERAVAERDRPAAARLRAQLARLQHFDPTADQVDEPEPPPDAILLLPARTGEAAATCLVVGGSPHLGPCLRLDTAPDTAASALAASLKQFRDRVIENEPGRMPETSGCVLAGERAILTHWWRVSPERERAEVLPVAWPAASDGWLSLAEASLRAARHLSLQPAADHLVDAPLWPRDFTDNSADPPAWDVWPI